MSSKHALIVGNSLYDDPHFPGLVTPKGDVEQLAEVLQSTEIGGFDDVKSLLNEPLEVLRRAIARFFNQRRKDDLLLLYLSGHGVLDDQGRLYFAVRDTEYDLLAATALQDRFVQQVMNDSYSRRQILIMDSCYSGAFGRGAKSAAGASVNVGVRFDVTGYGRVMLSASDAVQFAWEDDQGSEDIETSLFTRFLVKGLREGYADANGDGLISLDEWYDYAFHQVTQVTSKQRPQKFADRQQGEMVIARNPVKKVTFTDVVSDLDDLSDLKKVRAARLDIERRVEKLRREAFQQLDPSASEPLIAELLDMEKTLAETETKLIELQAADPEGGLLMDVGKSSGPLVMLGAEHSGLNVQVHQRMAQVPTSIYHLLDPLRNPLISLQVANHSHDMRRLRFTSYIEGYSAKAIDTTELAIESEMIFYQSPTLFGERLRDVNQLTRATLNVLVEDMDSGSVELQKTHPIWLLARYTTPLAVRDPMSGKLQDFSPYLGAFVTPNVPDLTKFLRAAADLHPQGRLVGYQGDPDVVPPQVMALFEALKREANIVYISTPISFTPEQGFATQRVRLPRESLMDRQANCIDGTVLFASLLEAIALSPAIVIVPGHVLVAWETWRDAPNEWRYLETTMIGTRSFEDALRAGETTATRYKALAEATKNPDAFKLWPLRILRSEYSLMPME